MKPGTSTSVRMGILNASQNRTKRAALRLESISRHPASTIGWFATTPIGAPFMRTKPVNIFLAKFSCNSKKSPWSARLVTSSRISYGTLAFSGTRLSRAGIVRAGSSSTVRRGRGAALWAGKKPTSRRISARASRSLSKAPSATEDRVVCVAAPPSSSAVTSSLVTVFTTSGPVTNI